MKEDAPSSYMSSHECTYATPTMHNCRKDAFTRTIQILYTVQDLTYLELL